MLEVIDRRRPVAQLRPLLAPALVDTVATLSRASAGSRDDAAVLRRVRLRTAVRDATDHDGLAAEVFATYTRGTRVRAIAARVESVHDADRWQLVALQVG